ncbi:MAG: IS200/IS605 family element transposase accessory protein TnpB [Gemmatimonadaceae bacterium]|nr:IS200/IS605 family element transposase accessory protein TnpB [Gloeobacterales cyanobacterium ES-bin-141]
MTQVLSVSCKLVVPHELRQEIERTLEAFANACNQILAVANDSGVHNSTKLHHLTYYPVRAATGLKANHVCQAIRRVVGALAAKRQTRVFRPTSIALDVRTFSFREKDWHVGLTLISGRVWLPLKIGGYQIALLRRQKPTSATLKKHRDGSYHINIAVELDTPPTGSTPKVIGVDLGRRDIATTSTGRAWSGEQLQATRNRYAQVRSNVQRKRTKSSRRLLRRLSGRERRFQSNINHTISKSLVTEARNARAMLAFEDLTGIRGRVKARGAKQQREGNAWAFYQLRLFVGYKASLSGVGVVFVDPRYTSQTCSCCHRLGDRNRKRFDCGWCGLSADADINAAINIAALGVTVDAPEGSTLYCEWGCQLVDAPMCCAG